MLYKIQNLTINIDRTDGEFAGDCIGYIPFSHKRFFSEACGMEKNLDFKNDNQEPIFTHEYGEIHINKGLGHYYTTSPDIIISYMGWLFTESGEQTIEVEYSDPFWAIHDAQHAINDESGCTIYVNAEIELERLHEAFKLMIANGYSPSYELIQEVNEAYNGRFGKSVDFAEDYLEDEYDEDDDEDEEE
jgi:hypothetical protein